MSELFCGSRASDVTLQCLHNAGPEAAAALDFFLIHFVKKSSFLFSAV